MRLLKTVVLLAISSLALHAYPYKVMLDTSSLVPGDYQLFFALTGNTGNTVSAYAFDFDGGAAISPPVLGIGNLNTSVTLDNTPPAPFFIEFAQNFTAGSMLTFFLNLSNNAPVAPDTPDNFSFALASTSGVNFDTTDVFGTNFLLSVDLTGNPLDFQIYSTLIAPAITPSVVLTPEPSYSFAIAGLLAAAVTFRRFRRT